MIWFLVIIAILILPYNSKIELKFLVLFLIVPTKGANISAIVGVEIRTALWYFNKLLIHFIKLCDLNVYELSLAVIYSNKITIFEDNILLMVLSISSSSSFNKQ